MGARSGGSVRSEAQLATSILGGLTRMASSASVGAGYEDQKNEQEPRGETQWPLWEVFTQKDGGAPHEHAGSIHAPDAEIALPGLMLVETWTSRVT